MRTLERLILPAIILVGGATPLAGQTVSTYEACYVPEVGAVYLINKTGLPSACLAPSHVAISWSTGALADSTVLASKLAFDPATQAELDAFVAGLTAAGTINTAGNPMDWTQLKNVPADFADGVDNSGGTPSDLVCTNCVGTTDLADAAVTAAKLAAGVVGVPHLAFDPTTQAELDAFVAGLMAAGTINTAGNPVDWTRLKNVPAGFADGVDNSGGTPSDLVCAGCVETTDLADGAVTAAKLAAGVVGVGHLAFDPATQPELDAHAASADHDGRYFTETELSAAGTINTTGNPVDWTRLKNVPADFADGVDNTGGGVTAHGALTGLLADDHPQYLLAGVRDASDGFAVTGTFNTGSIPTTGTGVRLMWYPRKAAFRAGSVTGAQWDDAKVGLYSTATGYTTTASGSGSTAMGSITAATGSASTAMGTFTVASGAYSTAMGETTIASGERSTAMGSGTTAQPYASLVIGRYNIVAGDQSQWLATDPLFVAGNGTSGAARSNALTLYKNGDLTIAGTLTASTFAGDGSGLTNLPSGVSDHGALTGLTDDDHPQYALADGVRSTPNGFVLTGTFGSGTLPISGAGTRLMWYPGKAAFRAGTAAGPGWDAASIGNNSAAFGGQTTASAPYAMAWGFGTTASGTYSTAWGYFTNATGIYSTAMGRNTAAGGDRSTAMGYGTTAKAQFSTAMGNNTTASGLSSTAMGSNTTAIGDSSTAMGSFTLASGRASTAMGSKTNATGTYSTAMGRNTTASGSSSTAMGNNTTASGNESTAMGSGSTASARNSTAMGQGTTAEARASLVIGQFNSLQDPTALRDLFVVGNGLNFVSRSNALVLQELGNLTIAGWLAENSDIRLKEDIEPLTHALDGVLGLTPIRYRFRPGTGHPTERQIGLSAQEVEQAFPELVSRDSEGYLSVGYTKLAAVLVRAVQEQQAEIEALRAEVAALRAAHAERQR